MNQILHILKVLTGQNSIYPFYHAVADVIPTHLKHLYSVRSVYQFEKDVKFFKSNYKDLDISNLTSNGFFITFDDGLREFKENAWPVLKKHQVPVFLFVNPAFVDNKKMFFRFKASLLIEHFNSITPDLEQITKHIESVITSKEQLVKEILDTDYAKSYKLDQIAELSGVDFDQYLKEKKPYLTKAELLDLQNEGVIIGAHSMDHPLFNRLNLVEQLKQITESCEWVKQNFNQATSLFSFPFTDFGLQSDLFDYMYNEIKLDYSFGTAGLKKELFTKHIQRVPMEDKTYSALVIVMKQYLYYLLKAPFFKNTIQR